MNAGIGVELDGIVLGDQRLNRRSVQVLETLAAQPQASINAACGGWAETVAAYRLFDHERVSPEKILAPHRDAALRRVREQTVVLIVQDTTELDFTAHPPRDARCLDKPRRFGVYDHTSLAVTPEGVCLGVVGQELFDRSPESLGKSDERAAWPIEQKESYRWLKGYGLACQIARDCPATRIVSVADSEADIYDIFVEGQSREHPADFLIRAKENRATPERDVDAGPKAYRKVRDEVADSPLRMRRTIELTSTPKRKARQAQLEIRACRVTVKPPHARSWLPPVTYNVVLAEEVHGPQDGTDVNWLLITTLPIDSHADLLQVLEFYLARWTIEVYFKVLKSGCTVEQMQLETMHRVRNCLAFYKIIAWRVLYLTYLNRECPDLPCDTVFDAGEWQPVWRIVRKTAPPKKPPRLGEFMKQLAELGGYNNRATEPPPGPQVIWMGLRRMFDFAIAWTAFQNSPPEVVYK